MINHFLFVSDTLIKSAKLHFGLLVNQTEELAVDVEKYEHNLTNMKQFHTKYENNLKFMKTISRYNPEVCFLECYKFELGNEWKQFTGLLLNLSCALH